MGAITHTDKNHLPSPAPCFGEELLPPLLLLCAEMLINHSKFSSVPPLQVSRKYLRVLLPTSFGALAPCPADLPLQTGAELWVCLARAPRRGLCGCDAKSRGRALSIPALLWQQMTQPVTSWNSQAPRKGAADGVGCQGNVHLALCEV